METDEKNGVFSSGLAIVVMVLLWTVPWFVAGLNLWGIFFICVALLLGLFEFISFKINGKSLSGMFWEFMKSNPKTGAVILVSLSVGWTILMLHLLHL